MDLQDLKSGTPSDGQEADAREAQYTVPTVKKAETGTELGATNYMVLEGVQVVSRQESSTTLVIILHRTNRTHSSIRPFPSPRPLGHARTSTVVISLTRHKFYGKYSLFYV